MDGNFQTTCMRHFTEQHINRKCGAALLTEELSGNGAGTYTSSGIFIHPIDIK